MCRHQSLSLAVSSRSSRVTVRCGAEMSVMAGRATKSSLHGSGDLRSAPNLAWRLAWSQLTICLACYLSPDRPREADRCACWNGQDGEELKDEGGFMSSGPAKACHPGSCGSSVQLHESYGLDSGRAGPGCICLTVFGWPGQSYCTLACIHIHHACEARRHPGAVIGAHVMTGQLPGVQTDCNTRFGGFVHTTLRWWATRGLATWFTPLLLMDPKHTLQIVATDLSTCTFLSGMWCYGAGTEPGRNNHAGSHLLLQHVGP